MDFSDEKVRPRNAVVSTERMHTAAVKFHLAFRAFYVIIMESGIYFSALNINELKFRYLEEVKFMQNDTGEERNILMRIRIFYPTHYGSIFFSN